MKISYDLLSPMPRAVWVEVPANLAKPALGAARVKLRELPKLALDTLWGELQAAEQAVLLLDSKAPVSQQAEVMEAQRVAERRFVAACVVDHDIASFEAALPAVEPGSPDALLVVAGLIQAGYSAEEASAALLSGVASKPFRGEPWSFGKEQLPGAHPEIVAFYERCTPDRTFFRNLLFTCRRFQDGEVLSACERWLKAGRTREEIPIPFGGSLSEERR